MTAEQSCCAFVDWDIDDTHDDLRLIVSGTAEQLTEVTGRLDWTAVWEDDGHVITQAQGDAGGAAIVRCDVDGACERASRVWDVPLPSEPSLYYEPPPVVLAQR